MRVLLVSYSGKPLHPDNFMPDNGLALLAAVIVLVPILNLAVPPSSPFHV